MGSVHAIEGMARSLPHQRRVYKGGQTLRPDDEASADVYGHPIKAKDIVRGNGTRVTTSGHALVNALQKSAPNNESERASNR